MKLMMDALLLTTVELAMVNMELALEKFIKEFLRDKVMLSSGTIERFKFSWKSESGMGNMTLNTKRTQYKTIPTFPK